MCFCCDVLPELKQTQNPHTHTQLQHTATTSMLPNRQSSASQPYRSSVSPSRQSKPGTSQPQQARHADPQAPTTVQQKHLPSHQSNSHSSAAPSNVAPGSTRSRGGGMPSSTASSAPAGGWNGGSQKQRPLRVIRFCKDPEVLELGDQVTLVDVFEDRQRICYTSFVAPESLGTILDGATVVGSLLLLPLRVEERNYLKAQHRGYDKFVVVFGARLVKFLFVCSDIRADVLRIGSHRYNSAASDSPPGLWFPNALVRVKDIRKLRQMMSIADRHLDAQFGDANSMHNNSISVSVSFPCRDKPWPGKRPWIISIDSAKTEVKDDAYTCFTEERKMPAAVGEVLKKVIVLRMYSACCVADDSCGGDNNAIVIFNDVALTPDCESGNEPVTDMSVIETQPAPLKEAFKKQKSSHDGIEKSCLLKERAFSLAGCCRKQKQQRKGIVFETVFDETTLEEIVAARRFTVEPDIRIDLEMACDVADDFLHLNPWIANGRCQNFDITRLHPQTNIPVEAAEVIYLLTRLAFVHLPHTDWNTPAASVMYSLSTNVATRHDSAIISVGGFRDEYFNAHSSLLIAAHTSAATANSKPEPLAAVNGKNFKSIAKHFCRHATAKLLGAATGVVPCKVEQRGAPHDEKIAALLEDPRVIAALSQAHQDIVRSQIAVHGGVANLNASHVRALLQLLPRGHNLNRDLIGKLVAVYEELTQQQQQIKLSQTWRDVSSLDIVLPYDTWKHEVAERKAAMSVARRKFLIDKLGLLNAADVDNWQCDEQLTAVRDIILQPNIGQEVLQTLEDRLQDFRAAHAEPSDSDRYMLRRLEERHAFLAQQQSNLFPSESSLWDYTRGLRNYYSLFTQLVLSACIRRQSSNETFSLKEKEAIRKHLLAVSEQMDVARLEHASQDHTLRGLLDTGVSAHFPAQYNWLLHGFVVPVLEDGAIAVVMPEANLYVCLSPSQSESLPRTFGAEVQVHLQFEALQLLSSPPSISVGSLQVLYDVYKWGPVGSGLDYALFCESTDGQLAARMCSVHVSPNVATVDSFCPPLQESIAARLKQLLSANTA